MKLILSGLVSSLCAVCVACSNGEAPTEASSAMGGAASGPAPGGSSSGGEPNGGGSAVILDAPDSAAELVPFLEAKQYAAWAAEPDYHLSAGPHGDGVRVFYSDKAAAALSAKQASFPAGAAVVKELTSQGFLYGWAVWVKVQEDSDDGRGFYWYELIKPDIVYGDERGSNDCVGCHTTDHDFLLSSGEFEPRTN
jgi:hypothetical protein